MSVAERTETRWGILDVLTGKLLTYAGSKSSSANPRLYSSPGKASAQIPVRYKATPTPNGRIGFDYIKVRDPNYAIVRVDITIHLPDADASPENR